MSGVAAAAAVVVHRGHVLLVRRRNPPDAGLWGYPGGHRAPGESVARTATRELAEETGIVAAPLGLLAVLAVARFRLAMVACRHIRGAPRPDDDVDLADWVPVREVLGRRRPMSRDVDLILVRALLSRAGRPPGCGTSPTWR